MTTKWARDATVHLCALVLLLLACKLGKPAQLTLHRDESAAAHAVIGIEGGTLDVKAADGTAFRLTVPKLALPGDTKIRAVPAALTGPGIRGWVLVLEPSGLQFEADALLTITPPVAVPVQEQFLFGMSDDQREVVAALVDVHAPTPTAVVRHFSSYGLAQTNEKGQGEMLRKEAADAERQLGSKVGAALQAQRRALSSGKGQASAVDVLESAFDEYDERVVKPRIANRGSSCEDASLALQTAAGGERQRALAGVPTSSSIDLRGTLDQGMKRNSPCEKEAIEQCKRSRDPRILIRFLLRTEHMRQLLELDTIITTVPDLVKEATKICNPSYSAKGGGGGASVTGIVQDPKKPFTLLASFPGGTATLSYTPGTGLSGTYTVSGGGSGAKMTGKGSYTITENDDGTLTLNQQDNSCVDVSGTCRDTKHVITLTVR